MGKNKAIYKYLAALFIQALSFYVFPLFAGPADAIGMVFGLLVTCFLISLIYAVISNVWFKWTFPAATAILFLPSVFIYYNESALIHALWYFVISIIGLGIGTLISKIFTK